MQVHITQSGLEGDACISRENRTCDHDCVFMNWLFPTGRIQPHSGNPSFGIVKGSSSTTLRAKTTVFYENISQLTYWVLLV